MDNIFRPLQRIVMLQALEQDPGRSMSNGMLQRSLKACGQNCGITEVNEQINWLEHRGYVETERPGDSGMLIVKILRPGIEVATGMVRADGIDPPPEE
jgi:hypothetical protein